MALDWVFAFCAVRDLLGRHAGVLTVWYRRMRDRTLDRDALAIMSDRDLMDMMATRHELLNELTKPFWRG